MDIAVVLRRFLNRQLQQGQVLAPGFGGVGVMIQLNSLGRHHRSGAPCARPFQNLVDGVDPLVAVAGVYFLIPEDHAL